MALISSNNPAVLNVINAHQALTTQTAVLETLFKINQASKITTELLELDARRDSAISGIGIIVDGYLMHYNKAIALAAKRLDDNLKLYGTLIARQNLQSETATLDAIINDWENKQELKDALDLLGLTEWKDEMKAANKLFDEKYLDRTQDYGAANPDTLKAERRETNQVYYQLRDRIAGFATLLDNPDPSYAKTINELNALIIQYSRALRDRIGETPGTPTAE